MPLTYTKRERQARDYLNDDDFADEVSNWATGVRQIKHEQLPAEGLPKEKFARGTSHDTFDTNPEGTRQTGQGVIQQTQSWFICKSDIPIDNWSPQLPRPTWGPLFLTQSLLGPPQIETFTDDGDVQGGVNSFITLNSNADGVFQRIPTKEGMLHIQWTGDVDFSHGYLRAIESNGPINVTSGIGNNWTHEIYLYVNDKPVSSTGELLCGARKTHTLHASIPIGEGVTEIDVRYKISFDIQEATNYLDEESGIEIITEPSVYRLFNAQLWTRNQFR